MGQRRRLAAWQIATLSAAGVVGALAAVNWLTQAGARAPEQALPGADPALYPWTEGTIAYSVRGRGEPMLLLHDLFAGSSAYEYRNVFAALATRYRVFAPDLLGYGRSGRPAISYTAPLYVALIEDLLRQALGATDQPAHVVAAGQSAAFAVLAAQTQPQFFASLTLIEPVGLGEAPSQRDALAARLRRLLLRAPLLGQSAYNALVSRPALRRTLRSRQAMDAARLSDDVLDQYYATAHVPGARFAAADGAAATLGGEASAAFESLSAPTLLLWGQRDRARPLAEALALRKRLPGAQLRIFPTGAMPHVDAPDAFTQELVAWLRAAVRV